MVSPMPRTNTKMLVDVGIFIDLGDLKWIGFDLGFWKTTLEMMQEFIRIPKQVCSQCGEIKVKV